LRNDQLNTLIVNVIGSLVVFAAAYAWLLKPVLPTLNLRKVLTAILLLHSLRHLGLMFLTTGVVAPSMPAQFAVPAAAGDTLSAALALIAAFLLVRESRWAIPMAWTFTVVGLIDFAAAIALSRIFRAADHMGGSYWIPSFWVPMLIVGHWIVIVILLQMKRQPTAAGV
jgi:hypothetical protein